MSEDRIESYIKPLSCNVPVIEKFRQIVPLHKFLTKTSFLYNCSNILTSFPDQYATDSDAYVQMRYKVKNLLPREPLYYGFK